MEDSILGCSHVFVRNGPLPFKVDPHYCCLCFFWELLIRTTSARHLGSWRYISTVDCFQLSWEPLIQTTSHSTLHLGNKPAKCEVERMPGCRENRMTGIRIRIHTETKTPSIIVRWVVMGTKVLHSAGSYSEYRMLMWQPQLLVVKCIARYKKTGFYRTKFLGC